jgi:hypothetical protein
VTVTGRSRRAARACARAAAVAGPVVAVVAAALVGGCTVGDGNGVVRGPIFVLGCGSNGENFGTPQTPRIFDLDPHFFAGEPIEDVAISMKENRLLMRIERDGNRIEVNDTLYIDIQNAYEVARCVRGRTQGGVPDYDTRMTTSSYTGQLTTTPWCDWSGGMAAGADGGDAGDAGDAAADSGAGIGVGADGGTGPAIGRHARIHLGTEELVRSSLSLLYTCHYANTTGMAFEGWIDFQDFGQAAQPNVAPEARGGIGTDFKVNFGDRLRATFEVTLEDQRVFGAIHDMTPLPVVRFIGGVLDGFFDFDLERGRAAQPFP